MIKYPPCKKCGKSHGMGIENMETGEITPIDICSNCLWSGYSPRKVEQPIYLDMQDDEIENKIDEVIQKVRQHMELCKDD